MITNNQFQSSQLDNNISLKNSQKRTKREQEQLEIKQQYEDLIFQINEEIEQDNQTTNQPLVSNLEILNQSIELNKLLENNEDQISEEEIPSALMVSSSSEKNQSSTKSKQNLNTTIQTDHEATYPKKQLSTKSPNIDLNLLTQSNQKLLSELQKWNQVWEKCILMASKVISYHSINAEDPNQQRNILIDIVKRLCQCIQNQAGMKDDSNYYKKYVEISDKREKDKKRLRQMEKRCEKLYSEVQKNREMIQKIENKKVQKQLVDDNTFIESLMNHQVQKKHEIDQQIELNSKQKMKRIHNDEQYNDAIDEIQHQKSKNLTLKSSSDFSDFEYAQKNDLDTNTSSCLSSSQKKINYSKHLKKMMSIVDNLEKRCNEIPVNHYSNTGSGKKVESSHSTSMSRNLESQLDDSQYFSVRQSFHDVSLQSFEKMHNQLIEEEKSLSAS